LLTGAEDENRRNIFDAPIHKRFPKRFNIYGDTYAEWERSSILYLNPKYVNCTKCSDCDSWITDKQKPGYQARLDVGEYVDEKIYCPECATFAREKLKN